MRMRIFNRFPILIIIVGVIVILNDIFSFAPAQVLYKPYSIMVPVLLIVIGAFRFKAQLKENISQK